MGGTRRVGMMDDLKEGSYIIMKRREEEKLAGKVPGKSGKVGCHRPAKRQNTHDDDDEVSDESVKK